MATIKPFISNDVVQAGPQLPTLSPDQVGGVEQATAQGFQAMSQQNAQIAQRMAARASSALSMHYAAGERSKAAQVQFENYVKTPEIIDAIAKGSSNETLLVMKQAEAARLEQLPGLEMNYLDTATPKIQEGYLHAREQALQNAAPDGSNYMAMINKYFDDATSAWMEQAPSAGSSAEMMNRIQDLKNQALTQGLKIQNDMRQDYSLAKTNEAGDSLMRQAIADPANFDTYFSQSMELQQTLKEAGFSDAEVLKWKQDQASKISVAHLESQLIRDPRAALSELAYSGIAENISPEGLISLAARANDAVQQQDRAEAQALDLQQAYQRSMTGGPLNPSVKADKAAGENIYDAITAGRRNPETGGIDFKNGGVEEIYQGLKQTKGMLPDQAKNDIGNAIRYGDFDSAVSASFLIKKMSQTPEMQHQAAEMDPKDFQLGILVSNAMAGGASAKDAVIDARKQLLSAPGSMDEMRNKQADIYLNNETIAADLEGQFSSWLAPIQGTNEFFMGHGYQGYGNKFFEPTNTMAAAGDYARHFRRAYLDSGDAAAAKEYATAQLSKTWAAATVNGDSQIMQYAPSIVFPGRELDFNHKFQEAKTTALPDIKDAADLIVDSVDYMGNNRAQLEAAYPVYIIDFDGIKRPLLDSNGAQMLYKYENGLTEVEKNAIIEAREKSQAIEEGRRKKRQITDDTINHLMKSPSVEKMTAQQKVMIRKQLQTINIGK
jgi:hypothetical protein